MASFIPGVSRAYSAKFSDGMPNGLGCPTPRFFDHPLMKLPTAQLPNPVPLPQPETPLLDAVIAKFKLEFPGSFTD